MSYSKPSSFTLGTRTISFRDGPDHQRFMQTAPEGNTLYFNCFGVHAELTPGNNWNDYFTVGNVMVGERVITATEQTTMYYFHTDHLGSISVITDQNGSVLQRLSYDAWGKTRLFTGADGQPPASPTTRGFTGQEELSVSGLVHLNGRVYDPTFGRMISADPTVPDPLDPQAWNRYSYVGNDPLSFTDPSGFSWLLHFFDQVASYLQANPLVRSILQIGLTTLRIEDRRLRGLVAYSCLCAASERDRRFRRLFAEFRVVEPNPRGFGEALPLEPHSQTERQQEPDKGVGLGVACPQTTSAAVLMIMASIRKVGGEGSFRTAKRPREANRWAAVVAPTILLCRARRCLPFLYPMVWKFEFSWPGPAAPTPEIGCVEDRPRLTGHLDFGGAVQVPPFRNSCCTWR